MSSRRPRRRAIVGEIGAGKTTFLNELARALLRRDPAWLPIWIDAVGAALEDEQGDATRAYFDNLAKDVLFMLGKDERTLLPEPHDRARSLRQILEASPGVPNPHTVERLHEWIAFRNRRQEVVMDVLLRTVEGERRSVSEPGQTVRDKMSHARSAC